MLSIDPVYNNNTTQLAFLWNMYNLPTRLMLPSMFMTSLHRTPTLQTLRYINLDLPLDINWNNPLIFFLYIAFRILQGDMDLVCSRFVIVYMLVIVIFIQNPNCDKKKCKWLFLAIQNYVILSLVQLTNKNIYMCTCRTVEYRYHHNVNHHLHWFFNTYLYRYMYVFRWIFHNRKSESNFLWR